MNQIESHLDEAKTELNNYKKQIKNIKELENELNKYKSELAESRFNNLNKLDEKDKLVNSQRNLIAEQISMMQIMEQDIENLENIINELNTNINEENKDKDHLLEILKIKESEITKAKHKRKKSTKDILSKVSNFSRRVNVTSPQDTQFTYEHDTNPFMLTSPTTLRITTAISQTPSDEYNNASSVVETSFRSLDPFDFTVCNTFFCVYNI